MQRQTKDRCKSVIHQGGTLNTHLNDTFAVTAEKILSSTLNLTHSLTHSHAHSVVVAVVVVVIEAAMEA